MTSTSATVRNGGVGSSCTDAASDEDGGKTRRRRSKAGVVGHVRVPASCPPLLCTSASTARCQCVWGVWGVWSVHHAGLCVCVRGPLHRAILVFLPQRRPVLLPLLSGVTSVTRTSLLTLLASSGEVVSSQCALYCSGTLLSETPWPTAHHAVDNLMVVDVVAGCPS